LSIDIPGQEPILGKTSAKKYDFAAQIGFCLDFERSNARSLDPVGQILANYCIPTSPMTKEVD